MSGSSDPDRLPALSLLYQQKRREQGGIEPVVRLGPAGEEGVQILQGVAVRVHEHAALPEAQVVGLDVAHVGQIRVLSPRPLETYEDL